MEARWLSSGSRIPPSPTYIRDLGLIDEHSGPGGRWPRAGEVFLSASSPRAGIPDPTAVQHLASHLALAVPQGGMRVGSESPSGKRAVPGVRTTFGTKRNDSDENATWGVVLGRTGVTPVERGS